jgi:hypothetical protein
MRQNGPPGDKVLGVKSPSARERILQDRVYASSGRRRLQNPVELSTRTSLHWLCWLSSKVLNSPHLVRPTAGNSGRFQGSPVNGNTNGTPRKSHPLLGTQGCVVRLSI